MAGYKDEIFNENCKEKKPTIADVYNYLDRHYITPHNPVYKLAEQFGISLIQNVNIYSLDKLNELLEYFISKSVEEQKSICDKIERQYANITRVPIELAKPKILTILESGLSLYHQKLLISKLEILEKMDTQDAEYWKLSQWLETLLAIPFGIYIDTRPGTTPGTKPGAQSSLQSARAKLDSVIYGQQSTKSHMLEIIARMISNPTTQGSIFAVEGLPGCGKTTLIKDGFSQILGLPFEFIPLGGANESAYLAGQNYTYIGSAPGRIIQALKKAKCMNPIFYFDELDKVSTTERGFEIMNLLIHITDPAQNGFFQDLYMDGIPVDLSRAIFVFSFNDRRLVNPILLDRMEIIRFHTYTPADKAIIIERHLIPQIMNKYYGIDSRIKCVLQNKAKIIKLLVSPQSLPQVRKISHNIANGMASRMASGKIKKKKVIREKTSGIRLIIRRIEKAIARINLEMLETGKDITKMKQKNTKIILTASMFERTKNNP
jgi:ATP-dependent Lon protease